MSKTVPLISDLDKTFIKVAMGLTGGVVASIILSAPVAIVTTVVQGVAIRRRIEAEQLGYYPGSIPSIDVATAVTRIVGFIPGAIYGVHLSNKILKAVA